MIDWKKWRRKKTNKNIFWATNPLYVCDTFKLYSDATFIKYMAMPSKIVKEWHNREGLKMDEYNKLFNEVFAFTKLERKDVSSMFIKDGDIYISYSMIPYTE